MAHRWLTDGVLEAEGARQQGSFKGGVVVGSAKNLCKSSCGAGRIHVIDNVYLFATRAHVRISVRRLADVGGLMFSHFTKQSQTVTRCVSETVTSFKSKPSQGASVKPSHAIYTKQSQTDTRYVWEQSRATSGNRHKINGE